MEPSEYVYNFTLMLCLNCPNVFWDDHKYFLIKYGGAHVAVKLKHVLKSVEIVSAHCFTSHFF